MEENTQNVQASAAEAQPVASATAPDAPAGEKQAFVPFFNEEYKFNGGLGDVGTAYRLGAIFIMMLLAAAMMYLCAWWWVGTHPMAQNQ